MNRKMVTASAQSVYKQRKVIVEPVFVKSKIVDFVVSACGGKEKVAGEFAMVCAVHNFKKIAKAILTGLIRPAFTNYAKNLAR